jgi:hypothetical protein
VNGLAVGIQDHDCLWNKVNDSPQLLFVRKEFGPGKVVAATLTSPKKPTEFQGKLNSYK